MSHALKTKVNNDLRETIHEVVSIAPSVRIHSYKNKELVVKGSNEDMLKLRIANCGKWDDTEIEHPIINLVIGQRRSHMNHALKTKVNNDLRETIHEIVSIAPSVRIHNYKNKELVVKGSSEDMLKLLIANSDKWEDTEIQHPWSYSMPNLRTIELDYVVQEGWLDKLKEDIKMVNARIMSINEEREGIAIGVLRGYKKNLVQYLRYYYCDDELDVQYFSNTIK